MNGMKWAGILAFAGSVAVLGASPARAQGTEDTMKVQKPITVLLGAYFPTDSDFKDAVGNNLLSVGVRYAFAKSKTQSPTLFEGFIDYLNKSRDRTVSDGEGGTRKESIDVQVTAIGVSARQSFASANEAGQPYAGVGIGVYTGKAGGESETRFGGKVNAGYQLNNGWLAEAEYTIITKKKDEASANGFQLRVGYRF